MATAILEHGPPTTPPHKSVKRSHNDSQDRDVPHSERSSPARRYQGKRLGAAAPGTNVHPLSIQAGPTASSQNRNTSPTPTRPLPGSLVDSRYGPEEDWSPIDDHPFFNPYVGPPTPSPPASAPPLSPTASSASPSPSVAPPSPSTTTPASPSSTARTVTPGPDDPMEDVNDAEPAFTAPTRAVFIAASATDRNDNPHRPSPAHNPADQQALTHYTGFQANHPLWNMPVIADHVVLENMSDDVVTAVAATPGNYLAVTVFCYGVTLANKYKNIHGDILARLEEVAGQGKVNLIKPVVKSNAPAMRRGAGGHKFNKFGPPIALIARCSAADAREKLISQATYGCTRALGFHVTPFNPLCLSWAVGFYRTDITDTPATTIRRLCYAMYDAIRNSSRLFSTFDRAMQGGSTSSRDEHLFNFASSFDGRFLPFPDSPVYVLFAKPCTTNPKLWDEIRAGMRITVTDDLEAFVSHANAALGHNICADCKLDCHLKYNCMYTVRDKAWWGPLDLHATIKDLRGGAESEGDEDEGFQRGAPRGRRGYAGRSRGQ
ncbi:hypothetical protein B0H12DRAFT_1218559 [Mycena haematopus]|nr:hypothetical protein B0H12DRAFT_1218559 [Mycena haematopus]